MFPDFDPATPNAYEGSSSGTETAPTVAGQANYISAMYPIADCASSLEQMGARFEQADPSFQDLLEIFDVRWNAGVNTSRDSGEKLREPTISGLTEFADEDAKYPRDPPTHLRDWLAPRCDEPTATWSVPITLGPTAMFDVIELVGAL